MSASTPLRFDTVDVFTSDRYNGNQLAIIHVPKDRDLTLEQRHQIANEFGYSESVFLHAPKDGASDEWSMAIHTIEHEIPLAGHPVIGTAYLLGKLSGKSLAKGTLVPAAGLTPFLLSWLDNGRCEATVTMPQTLHVHSHRVNTAEVLSSQKALEAHLRKGDDIVYPIVSLVKGMTFILVELSSYEALGSVVRNFSKPPIKLDKGWEPSLGGWYFFYVERYNEGPVKIHCRMLGTDIGEDPATGSAACTLTAFLSQQAKKNGRSGNEFEYQVTQGEHMGRKSIIKTAISVSSEAEIKRIVLKGTAVHVMSGVINQD